MQYLLNEEEYKEYMILRKANSESAILKRVIAEEALTERTINEFHNKFHTGELRGDFNKVMWKLFDNIKSKPIRIKEGRA